MSRMWLVARHQYTTMAGKRTFLLVTIGFPVLIAVVMAIAIVFSTGRQDQRPVGVVDQAGILNPAPASGSQGLRAFDTLEDGQRALEAGEVQAVYLLPPDYVESRRVERYYWENPPGDAAQGRLHAALRASAAAKLPVEVRERATEGADGVRDSRAYHSDAGLFGIGIGIRSGLRRARDSRRRSPAGARCRAI